MLNTVVHGDADAARRLASEFRRLAASVSEQADVLSDARSDLAASWAGTSADAAGVRIRTLGSSAQTLADRLNSLRTATERFAYTHDDVSEAIRLARAYSTTAGLRTTASAIVPPLKPEMNADLLVHQTYAELDLAYRRAESAITSARDNEAAAHRMLTSEIRTALDRGSLNWFLTTSGAFPSSTGAGSYTLWGLAGASTGLGIFADWRQRLGVGRFAPRGPDGRFRPIHQPWRHHAFQAPLDRNWVARPHQAQSYAQWKGAGRWIGRAGTAVAASSAAWAQWQADADDPSLGNAERTGRWATVGATTGAGAWAGAAIGVKGGAVAGMAIGGPVGAVVGAALGGIVGGAVGSAAGQALGEAVKDVTGAATETAMAAIGTAWSATSSGLSSFGDAITFWD